MKYRNEILIDLPKEQVVSLFDNPDNMQYWQKGLQSYEQLSDEPGKAGAQMKLVFLQGKRPIEMIETIVSNDLPDSITTTYETKGVFNHMVSHFDSIGADRTLYWSENEFRFEGLMKVMGLLFKGSFQKQTQQYMVAFKEFAEGQPVKRS